jgi:nicotinamidase/pyrazinamidase
MTDLFLDVDTQFDFLYPTGALSVPRAVRILPQLAALTRYAESQRVPIVSTCDAHLEDDREFSSYRAHCVAGTLGASKVPETVTRSLRRISVGESFEGDVSGQVVMEKRSTDMFTERGIAALLERLAPERFVVYGVVTEICVMHAVQGLLRLGKPVTLVRDAVFSLEDTKAQTLLRQWKANGCEVVHAEAITGVSGNG